MNQNPHPEMEGNVSFNFYMLIQWYQPLASFPIPLILATIVRVFLFFANASAGSCLMLRRFNQYPCHWWTLVLPGRRRDRGCTTNLLISAALKRRSPAQ